MDFYGHSSIEGIAKICHEANRAYCENQLDGSQLPWSESPQWQRDSAVNGVRFHLESLQSGVEPPPSASHDNWLKEKVADGWTYGEVKSAEKKTHPCCVPYEELPTQQKVKDYIFSGICKAFYLAYKD